MTLGGFVAPREAPQLHPSVLSKSREHSLDLLHLSDLQYEHRW